MLSSAVVVRIPAKPAAEVRSTGSFDYVRLRLTSLRMTVFQKGSAHENSHERNELNIFQKEASKGS